MTQLTPEQKAYKEKTLNQLRASFSLLEAKLEKEHRLEIADEIREQLEDMHAHINHLQQELANNEAGEPIADELYRRVAVALTNQRIYLAKKLINKLETIEPYYPEIDRLRADAEAGRASRRTQSISKGGALPEIVLAPEMVEPKAVTEPTAAAALVIDQVVAEEPKKRGWSQLFQFHIIVSCLVVALIACVMFGVGGMTLLQWLVEGG